VTEPKTLAPGGRLLHIGFRKCGTTAIQGALRRARAPLAAAGVVYPGKHSNHTFAALAITERTRGAIGRGARSQPMRQWTKLVDEVARITPQQRAIVSSEFFDVADEPTIRKIVSGLGGDRMDVVVTLRPLSKILPSAWQQQVQGGLQRSYGDWLKVVFEGNDTMKTHESFWERHNHAEVLSRWASVVGPERVTLIVLDEHDRGLPYRSFETMLGAPAGTLREEPNRTNRSMSSAEVELIRQINKTIFTTDVTWNEYNTWIYRGASERVLAERVPEPDEPRTVTPRWALERATEISAGFSGRIEGLGITVVGDLQRLAALPPASGPEVLEATPTAVPMQVAVEAVLGSAFSLRKPTRPPEPPPPPPPSPPGPADLPARELARLLAARCEQRLRAWRRRRPRSRRAAH
jgi:hypothetical protein